MSLLSDRMLRDRDDEVVNLLYCLWKWKRLCTLYRYGDMRKYRNTKQT